MNISEAGNVVSSRRHSIEGVFAGDVSCQCGIDLHIVESAPNQEQTLRPMAYGHHHGSAQGFWETSDIPSGLSRPQPPDISTTAHLRHQAAMGNVSKHTCPSGIYFLMRIVPRTACGCGGSSVKEGECPRGSGGPDGTDGQDRGPRRRDVKQYKVEKFPVLFGLLKSLINIVNVVFTFIFLFCTRRVIHSFYWC